MLLIAPPDALLKGTRVYLEVVRDGKFVMVPSIVEETLSQGPEEVGQKSGDMERTICQVFEGQI